MSKNFLGSILLVFLLSSCLKERYHPDQWVKPDWEPELGLPVGTFYLNMRDVVLDYPEVESDSVDGFLRMTYRNDTLLRLSAEEYLRIPAQPIQSVGLNLGILQIDSLHFRRSIPIGELADRLDAQTSGLIQQAIQSGQSVPLPAIPPQSAGNFSTDTNPSLQSLEFSEGTLRLAVHNGLPMALDSLVMEVQTVNPAGGPAVTLGIFRLGGIASGAQSVSGFSLAGSTVYSSIKINLSKIQSNPQGISAIIPPSASLNFEFVADSLQVVRGVGKLPRQTFDTDTAIFEFTLQDTSLQLHQIRLQSGQLNIQAIHNLSLNGNIAVELPDLIGPGGQPTTMFIPITTCFPSSATQPLAGAWLYLDRDIVRPWNRFRYRVTGQIDSSQGLISIDSSQSIQIFCDFQQPEFEEVVGALGQRTIDLPKTRVGLDLSFFDRVDGSFFLANPSFSIESRNSVGVSSELFLDMQAKSTDGRVDSLAASPARQPIQHPSVPGQTAVTVLSYNRNNSRLPYLISLPPDTLSLSGHVNINPNPGPQTNFIRSDSRLEVGLTFDLPFELSLTNLGFTDTLEAPKDLFKDVLDARFNFQAMSTFPFQLDLKMIFLDSLGSPLHEEDITLIPPASVDAQGRVVSPTTGRSVLAIDRTEIDRVRSATHWVLGVRLNTSGQGTVPVRLYSDYFLRLKTGVELRTQF
ncbi:MAG: hypothetical protein FJ344_03845 [Sphingomonadales bacterium]|nr:hypothetical protein [Sphingomonadales bacterium]